MIARRFQRPVDAAEDPGTRVLDLRHLAVERSCAHDLAAKGLANGLMTEADTEDWNGWRCFGDEIEANAGFVRRARSGRQHDRIRL